MDVYFSASDTCRLHLKFKGARDHFWTNSKTIADIDNKQRIELVLTW